MVANQNRNRQFRLFRFFMTLTVCGLCLLSVASAGPIAKGVDSFTTLDASFGIFSVTPIPADFFDPGSDPFTDLIACQGVPFAPNATTDTLVERLAKQTC